MLLVAGVNIVTTDYRNHGRCCVLSIV